MGDSGTGSGDTPAGWYPDPQVPGQQRWWDGTAWTEHTAPLTGSVATPQGVWAAGGATAIPRDQIPDTWLWQSIVATVLCCMPLGIAGIVFSSQAQTAVNLGDLAQAQQKAQQAKTFTLVSAGLGLIPWVLGLIYILAIFLFGFASGFAEY